MAKRERWRCGSDFGAGGRGSIEFKVTRSPEGGGLSGFTEARGSTHKISGFWKGESIRFTRRLSATSIQVFKGVAVEVDAETVRMGGRFAAGFRGVWSADCSLLEAVDLETPRADETPPRVGISASGAFQRTEGEDVLVRATATDNTRVRQIRILVNGRPTKTCMASKCSTTLASVRPGKYELRADATDAAGNLGKSGALTVTVSRRQKTGPAPTFRTAPPTFRTAPSPTTTGSCSISGSATGPARDVSSLFRVFLSGPTSDSKPIRSGRYHFEGLHDGRYRLTVKLDAKADTTVSPRPASRSVVCSGAAITGVDFEFRR